MIDKIKALQDKKLLIIGVALILLEVIYLSAVLAHKIAFNRWIDFAFYFLSANGLIMIMSNRKKLKNK